MSNSKAHTGKDSFKPNPNTRYTSIDAIGKQHTIKAGEEGVTEEWIAQLRHWDNELRTSDFRYYHKWNGKKYVRVVFRSDDLSPAEREHYSTMRDTTADVERLFIEREEKKWSHARYLAAMAALTQKQKELVHMLFDLGMSKTEAAQEESIIPTSIQSRWECICKKFVKFFK